MSTNSNKQAVKGILIIFLVLIVVRACITTANKKEEGEATSNTASEMPIVQETPKEEIYVSASALFTDYMENEVAADEKYKYKTLHVKGEIRLIGKDFGDAAYVIFYTDGLGEVQCEVDKNTAMNLKKGKTVTLVGQGGGRVMGQVLVYNCRLE